MELGGVATRPSAVRLVRWARLTGTVGLLVTAGTLAAGCAAAEDARERAADAAAAASSWSDPAVQHRWSTSLVGRSPLVDSGTDLPRTDALASLSQGLVTVSPGVGDTRAAAVVDYATSSDQKVLAFGARTTLRTLAVHPHVAGTTCRDGAACEEVRVTAATPTTMVAATARGTASVPAWAYTVVGLTEPLMLPAVRFTSASDVNPNHFGVSISQLLGRDRTTLRVLLFVPYCGGTPNQRHLLETDAVIVVWASAKPNDDECAAPVRREETFSLRAPIGDRPVVDESGRLLLPPEAG